MSLLAALFLLQGAHAPEPASSEEDDTILVLAAQLERIEVRIGQDHEGRWHCSLSASSGHDRVDDKLCRAATACYRANGNDQGEVLDCLSRSRGNILLDFRRRYERARQ